MLERLVAVFGAPPRSAKAVLLGGVGDRHFSSGIDLGERDADALVEYLPAQEVLLRQAADAIAECPVPVIGVINGAAFGGALELAVACDWRVACERARFGMPATRLGVVYSPSGLVRFIEALGTARTKQLFLTGAAIDAQRAREIGLVEDVVQDDLLWSAAEAAAAHVAAAAPVAVEETRALIDRLAHNSNLDAVHESAANARRRAFTSQDFREALAAFREDRPPEFQGR